MDPFVQYQNNVQSEAIKTQVANLLQNLNLADAGDQHLNTFLERPADPIQDVITDFNFVIPQFTLDQIFALPAYSRPKHMISKHSSCSHTPHMGPLQKDRNQ